MNELIDKARRALRLSSDIELAEYLGISRKTLWQQRQKPYSKKLGLIYDLIIENEELKIKRDIPEKDIAKVIERKFDTVFTSIEKAIIRKIGKGDITFKDLSISIWGTTDINNGTMYLRTYISKIRRKTSRKLLYKPSKQCIAINKELLKETNDIQS